MNRPSHVCMHGCVNSIRLPRGSGASTYRMLGDEMDYGTASSRQSQASEIRTDGRNIIIQELLELRNEVTHQQGYQADSSTDDDSSEGSFNITAGQGDQHQNSILLSLPRWPPRTRQRGRRRTVQEALQR
jgi:hypothetical protein